MSKRCGKLFGIILLAVFTGQFLRVSIFPHTHIMKGVVVVHSHPYDFFKKGHHQHTESEIIHIDQISHAVFTTPVVFTPLTPSVFALDIPTNKKLTFADVSIVIHFLLRAPPFVVY